MTHDSDMKRIGGLWLQEKNGRKFLSGKLDERVVIEAGCRLFVFAAKERRTDKSPSHYVCVAPAEARQDDRGDENALF
jgi:hypothetical protein